MPCYDADSGHPTENRQRTNGSKRCAGWSLHQDPLYRVRIIADQGLNLVELSTGHRPQKTCHHCTRRERIGHDYFVCQTAEKVVYMYESAVKLLLQ